MSTSYIFTLSFAFFIGSFILDKPNNICTLSKEVHKHNNRIIINFAFYACFAMGCTGTFLLLKNLYHGNLLGLFPYFMNNFVKFDRNISTTYSLWNANTAVLFWAVFIKDNWLKFIIIFISAINILFRGHFLYMVVAAFYYIVPILILGKKKHFNFIIIFVLIFILIPTIIIPTIIIPTITQFQNPDNNVKKRLIALTPYTFGNFTNYNIYFNEMYTKNHIYYDLVDISRYLGSGSIMLYSDRYLGTDFLKYVRPEPFNNQLHDYTCYGNLATIYSGFTKVPYLLAIFFSFFLGLLNRLFYNRAYKSLFFLSIYSWFAATNFMAFAGAGYFTSTRIIPAVLYIWPFLLVMGLLNMSISISHY